MELPSLVQRLEQLLRILDDVSVSTALNAPGITVLRTSQIY